MIAIHQVTNEHLQQLVILFNEYRVWYGQPSDIEGAEKFLRARMTQQDSVVYGAFEEKDTMVGFTQLYPLYSSTRLGRLWLLNDLYVSPKHRGQGISVHLIDRAKDLATETEAVGVMLETEKSNDIGNNLYPRTGFVLEEDFNHYFWARSL